MTTKLTEAEREERLAFLQRRQRGIGGSDLPVILGLSSYRNALDVYYDKTRPIREEDIESDTIHQLRGHLLEPVALAHYWKHTGRKGRAVRKAIKHPAYPHVAVSRDFEVFSDAERAEGMRGRGVGEIKCPMSSVFRAVHEHGLRDSELVQLQTNIAVARDSWGTFCYFNVEDKDGPVLAFDQIADPDMGKFLLESGERFWTDHVELRVPPDPAAWRLLAQPEAPKLLELSGTLEELPRDDVLAQLVSRTLDAKDTASEAEDHYRELQAQVFEQLKTRGIGKAQIPGLARLTIVTKAGSSRFDRERLDRACPLDRDKVEAWLREQSVMAALDLPPAEVGRMLFETQLDLGGFETQGAPSQYLLAKRSASE